MDGSPGQIATSICSISNPTSEEIIEYTQLHKDQESAVIRRQYEHEEITPENNYSIDDEEFNVYDNEEQFAIDLRTNKSPDYTGPPSDFEHSKKNKREIISIAELLENFSCNDSCINKYPTSNPLFTNSSSVKEDHVPQNYRCYDETCDSKAATDYSTWKQNLSERIYGSYQTRYFQEDTTANTHPVVFIDQESQTWEKETKDASVQTDLEPKLLAYSLFKHISKNNVKYTCLVCQRLYTTKSSYDRHLKTHMKSNKKIITNVRFTTEAKLKVYKKHVKKNQVTHGNKPLIIEMSQATNFQCGLCQKFYLTQNERDDHDCIIEPFPLTKCPKCNIRFYTLGALNDHVSFTHKRDESNSYYCIFCNESFDSGYTFHLHLDKHLYP